MDALTDQRKLVLVSIAVLAIIAVYRERQGDGGSLYKRLWGLGVIGVVLSILSDFVPQITGPFAVLLVLGSLSRGGDKAIQSALASVGSRIPAGASSPRTATPLTGVTRGGVPLAQSPTRVSGGARGGV